MCTSSNHGDFLVRGHFWLRLLVLPDGELAVSVVDEETAGAADVDGVANLHVVEVLGHLAAVGELGVDVFEVNLHHQVDKAYKQYKVHEQICVAGELESKHICSVF